LPRRLARISFPALDDQILRHDPGEAKELVDFAAAQPMDSKTP
jgi:hypothetical protein